VNFNNGAADEIASIKLAWHILFVDRCDGEMIWHIALKEKPLE
jgi:hypothetical protein